VKSCSGCKNIKQFDEFTKARNRSDGLHNQCKQCRRESFVKNISTRKKYLEVNKEKIAENRRMYYSLNKLIFSEKAKQYRLKNSDRFKINRTAYRIKNKEKLREMRHKQWLKVKNKVKSHKKLYDENYRIKK
jgi:hypothetical protein